MSMLTIIFTILFFIFAVLAINILHILQAKGSVLKVAGLIVVFAVVFTQSSILWTKDATFSWKVVRPLETGWPIPFHYEPHPMNQVWEPSSTSGSNFFFSVLINSGLWLIVFFLLELLFRKTGVVVKSLSFELILLGLVSLVIVIISINFINAKTAQLQNPGINNPVTLPPAFVNPAPVRHPAN